MACLGGVPDCGIHNSVQILTKNLELANKELALAQSAEKELADHLIGDALENVVSALDGFGREICLQKGANIRFQNLSGARCKVQEVFGFDFADTLGSGDWESACRVFQKRHVLAHKMGVIDADYVQKANDPGAIIGRKIRVSHDEVKAAIRIIGTLGGRLFDGVLKRQP
jgi:endo-1,4-beta-D-glucanase Y